MLVKKDKHQPYRVGQRVENTRTGEKGHVLSVEGLSAELWLVVVVVEGMRMAEGMRGFQSEAEGCSLWRVVNA